MSDRDGDAPTDSVTAVDAEQDDPAGPTIRVDLVRADSKIENRTIRFAHPEQLEDIDGVAPDEDPTSALPAVRAHSGNITNPGRPEPTQIQIHDVDPDPGDDPTQALVSSRLQAALQASASDKDASVPVAPKDEDATQTRLDDDDEPTGHGDPDGPPTVGLAAREVRDAVARGMKLRAQERTDPGALIDPSDPSNSAELVDQTREVRVHVSTDPEPRHDSLLARIGVPVRKERAREGLPLFLVVMILLFVMAASAVLVVVLNG